MREVDISAATMAQDIVNQAERIQDRIPSTLLTESRTVLNACIVLGSAQNKNNRKEKRMLHTFF